MSYELKRLNPRVVDVAIKLIQDGKQHYTCHALDKAARAIHKKGEGGSYPYVKRHRLVHTQTEGCWPVKKPVWWNSAGAWKPARVRGLEKLKAAIVADNEKGKK